LTEERKEIPMPVAIFDEDFQKADAILGSVGLDGLRQSIANAVAAERNRCAEIARAMDSKRGNENLIAEAIMSIPLKELGDSRRKRSRC
jgi:hypothetical protein